MQLNSQQLEAFERDGFLIFPSLFSKAEVAALVAECDRLACIEADYIKRALPVANPRPDHVRSTHCAPIGVVADSGILDAWRARKRASEVMGIG